MVELQDGAGVGIAQDGRVVGPAAFHEAVDREQGPGLRPVVEHQQVDVGHRALVLGVVERLQEGGSLQGEGAEARPIQTVEDARRQGELSNTAGEGRPAVPGQSFANLGRPPLGFLAFRVERGVQQARDPLLASGHGDARCGFARRLPRQRE